MARDWKKTKLGAEVDFLTGFPFKSENYTDDSDSIRLVRGDNIVQGALRWDGVKRWPSSDCSDYDLYRLREGDVVLAMDRPWIAAGLKYARISKFDIPSLLVQRTARLRGGPNLDTGYLRYVIGSLEFTQHIQAVATGSIVPHISGNQIKDFDITLPPLAEQKTISGVLSALDAKIELNHRINAELEGLAKLLYDYWFVQFEFPLTAAHAAAIGKPKHTGHPYLSSGGPMVHDPQLKRKIPKGWKLTAIADLVPIGKDTINPSANPEKLFKLFSIPGFDQTGTHRQEPGSAIGSNKFTVVGTDLLVSKLNPWTNRVIYPADEPDMVCSTEFVVMRPRELWMKNFLYMLATDPSFVAFCSQSATGTSNSHKRVNPSVMTSYGIPYSADVARTFGETVHPMLSQRLVLQQQCQELTALRDWLLPMLMNGQVRVG